MQQDRGWGSPDTPAPIAPITFDRGWGSPDAVGTEFDRGWGSPDYGDLIHIFLASPANVPDDGGELIRLYSEWPTLGPYRVVLLDSYTGKQHPIATDQIACSAPLRYTRLGAIAPRPASQWYDCFIEPRATVVFGEPDPQAPQQYLVFILPPVPPGLYDVRVSFGAHFGTVIDVASALRVVYRGRSREQWAMRTTFPRYYEAGVLTARAETKLGE